MDWIAGVGKMDYSMNQLNSKRLSARDFAYFELKRKILEGELAPGQPIVEEELSSDLGISRTPLRGGLQQLEFESLVERKSNGRLIIPSISIKEVEEIFTVRASLEGIAIEQATENATDEDIRILSNIIFMIKKTYSDAILEEILHYGSQFHNYIYNLSGNQTVSKILSQLNDHIYRYRKLVPRQNVESALEAKEEHEYILECIERRDKKAAKVAMQTHIFNSMQSAKNAIILMEQKEKEGK